MQLIIANKRYSSWTLRAWLTMTHFAIPFDEKLIPLDTPKTHTDILAISPSGRVPVLVDGSVAIWETLAIIEYLAESNPDVAIWPREKAARALARSISSEMHAGFGGLRNACPMNLRKIFAWRDWGEAAAADVTRIVEIWRDARSQYGNAGAFLFGDFSAADAMFAPVVWRLHGYSWPVEPDTRSYMDAVLALPAMQSWKRAADAETWIVPSDEIAE